MRPPQALCYMSDLLGHKIVTDEGKRVGHVADVVLTPDAPHKVTGLLYGEGGWEYRLHLLNPFITVKHPQAKPSIIPLGRCGVYRTLHYRLESVLLKALVG